MSSLTSSGGKQASALALLVSLVVTLLIAVGCGSSQDVATAPERSAPERTPFLIGQVSFPNGEPVEGALVRTQPFTSTAETDSAGVFHFYETMGDDDYQFIAEHRDYPEQRGQTSLSVHRGATPDSLQIVMGRSMAYEPIDVDKPGSDIVFNIVRTGSGW